MRTASDIYRTLDEIAPFSQAAEWDPVGFQLGDPDRTAGIVGVCHEVTTQVIAAAKDASVNVLVAYHPVLFVPTQSLVAGPTPTGRALALAEAGIALIVTHTAFDVASGGTAEALAASLGLEDQEPFGNFDLEAGDGTLPVMAIGRTGRIAEQTLSEFANLVGQRLTSPALRVAGDGGRAISRVAVVPGSGSTFVSAAVAANADVLVTGDVSHHRAVGALDAGLAVIDAGHIPTERPGMAALRSALGAALGEEPVDLTAVEADPWA